MPKLFVENSAIRDDSIIISGQNFHHLFNALRVKAGETVIVSADSELEYHCRISEIDSIKKTATAKIIDISKNSAEPPVNIILFQSVPKLDKMELIIQKTVELGIFEIVPVISSRVIVKIDEQSAQKKLHRWAKISESASKQCGRGIIPRIHNIMKFSDALKYCETMDYLIVAYENEYKRNLYHVAEEIYTISASAGKNSTGRHERIEGLGGERPEIQTVPDKKRIGLIIGPEGGLSNDEIDAYVNINAVPVTLGKRILRTETAGMYAVSVLLFLLEGLLCQ